ncbi:3-deoxy-D-manno-octulosonic acid transferase, partial [hydrothermal vent metagenome]
LWQKLTTKFLLVIVPRHPNRSLQIQKQLDALNIQYRVRSKKQKIFNDTKIYLADTLGELTQFIQDAECVFIGGSLIKHGGQNILEPCRLGKPTICGPYMFNFKEEMEFLQAKNACLQVNSLSELEMIFTDFTNNPESFKLIGSNAKSALQKQSTILDTYISILFKPS